MGECTIRLGYAPFLIAIAFRRVGSAWGPTDLNWSLGLDDLIWREIRSRPKTKSKIDLDENLGFQSNLMKIRSQHLFTSY